MRVQGVWSDVVPERDGVKSSVWDLAFSPDGQQMVAAAGSRVLVYHAATGDLQHSLKSHKDTVYSVDWSADGDNFASAGADNTVIIWTAKAEGVLKYSHSDSIQKVKFNPVTRQLVSCTASDFGLCVPEEKSVTRTRVGSRILCCDWSADGQVLALGLYSGEVSLRDGAGAERATVQRGGPVWSLSFSPVRGETPATLAVGCWDGTLSFYQASGVQLGKDRALGFDPCSVSYFDGGKYLLVGGSDRQVSLYSRDGVRLCALCETDDWCWVAKGRPGLPYIAAGSNSGAISVHHCRFTAVNGLYQDRFAFTEAMTDVVVQHLLSEQKVRIKSRDYVKKVALYRNRLAVLQPDKIVVYELTNEADPFDLRYRVKARILLGGGAKQQAQQQGQQQQQQQQQQQAGGADEGEAAGVPTGTALSTAASECALLAVTAQHVILCADRKLQLLDFSGNKHKEWVLESVIRYMKVVGGPVGREGLLVGLKNGQVLRLFVDNPFPVPLIKHRDTIRCLDLSRSRDKLAVVDVKGDCVVYDLESREELFSEKGAWSVAWNAEHEEMLCFSGDGSLSIKTGAFPVHQQPMQGIVVGFAGSKVFSLQALSMETIDVPQSASLYRYLEAKDYRRAYEVACLGVTESDWRFLALTALQDMALDTARQAFIRVRDLKMIELINGIEQQRRKAHLVGGAQGPQNNENSAGSSNSAAARDEAADPNSKQGQALHLAKIMAYQGRFQEAAKLYAKVGRVELAVDMFSDLRLWEEAKQFAGSNSSGSGVDVKSLIRRQAEWAEETGDWKLAADMYLAVGQNDRAVEIVGEQGRLDELIEVARKTDKAETGALRKCAHYFRQFGHHQFAKEVLLKIGDIQQLMKLHVESSKWDEAFLLSEQHGGKYAEDVYLPYAQWLAENDRFDEAQAAFKKARKPDKSIKMLRELSQSAITEQRYDDAAYYLWLLSEEKLAQGGQGQGDAAKRRRNINSNNEAETEAEERERSAMTPSQRAAVAEHQHFRSLSQVYYAYAVISRYTDEPFSSLEPEAVFNAGRFLVNVLGPEAPFGISRAAVLWAVGKQAEAFQAYKLARFALDKLGLLCVPELWAPHIDIETLLIQGKPYSDREEHHFICYCCSTTNPLINSAQAAQWGRDPRDACVHCGHPFIRSMRSFDLLPLVEFRPDDRLSDAQALELLRAEMPKQTTTRDDDEAEAAVNRVSFEDEPQAGAGGDAFSSFLLAKDFSQQQQQQQLLQQQQQQQQQQRGGAALAPLYTPLAVPSEVLKLMSLDDVFVVRWPVPKRWQFFKNLIPDVKCAKCPQCHAFFHEEDLETACLSNGSKCPLCKVKIAT